MSRILTHLISEITLLGHQTTGLSIKNFHVQRRQYKSNICCLVTPILCLLLIFGLEYLVKRLVDSDQKPTPVYPRFDAYMSSQTAWLYEYLRSTENPPINPEYLFSVDQSRIDPQYLGTKWMNGSGYGVFGQLWSQSQLERHSSIYYTPALKRTVSPRETDEIFYETLNKNIFLPYPGAFSFNQWNESVLDYTVQYSNFSGISASYACTGMDCKNRLVSAMINMVNRVYVSALTEKSIAILTESKSMPFISYPFNAGRISSFLGLFFYPLILCTILPILVYPVLKERVTQLREYMRINGMKFSVYVSVTYMSQYFMYLVSALVFVILSALFDFEFIRKNNPFIMLLFFIGWGFMAVSFSWLLASILRSITLGVIVSYIVILFGAIVGATVEGLVFKMKLEPQYIPLMLIFPLPLSHFVATSAAACEYDCLTWSSLVDNIDVGVCIGFMYLCGILYLLLALYIDQIFPIWGIRKNPCFCFSCFCWPIKVYRRRNRMIQSVRRQALYEQIGDSVPQEEENSPEHQDDITLEVEETLFAEKSTHAANLTQSKEQMASSVLLGEEEDENVTVERKQIEDGTIHEHNSAIVVQNVHKYYGKKKAVNGVYLSIGTQKNSPHGEDDVSEETTETISITGANGAGKTTTVQMILGMIPPTKGDIFVNGYSVRDSVDVVHRYLGYCPQQNIFFDDLTVWEHVMFFCQVKGIPLLMQRKHARFLLETVGLYKSFDEKKKKMIKVYNRKAKNLSGGMMRRLQLAISLVACFSTVPIERRARCVLLDEFSAGIDIQNIQDLWKVINIVKKQCNVILVSHSFEEAEELSDRICIMIRGKIKVIGTPNELKSKFGKGYRIELNLIDPSEKENATNFLREIIPNVQLISRQGNTLSFECSAREVRVGELFNAMSQKNEHGIKEWSIDDSSLEDVFLRVVAEEEQE